ncbi:hypothetical protein B0H13DRAFT_1911684 [Mycena leptocephala]|nr:hypothetical protein B0H13DRAFT_1911684 [Mycena leptocephala]
MPSPVPTIPVSPLAQSILDSIAPERRINMINDFWLALRLIPKPKMDLLKRMFSFQGFSQVLNELKRPLVIQFLVDLIPYLRDHVACRTLRLGDPPFLGNYFLAGLSRTGDRVDHNDQRLAGFEIPPLGSPVVVHDHLQNLKTFSTLRPQLATTTRVPILGLERHSSVPLKRQHPDSDSDDEVVPSRILPKRTIVYEETSSDEETPQRKEEEEESSTPSGKSRRRRAKKQRAHSPERIPASKKGKGPATSKVKKTPAPRASNVKPKAKTSVAASRKKTTANAILEAGPDFTAYTREDDRLATELNLDGPPIPIIHPEQLEEATLAQYSSELEDLKRAETQYATAALMADEAERNYVFFLRRALKRFLVDYSELAPNDPTLADPTVQNLSTEAAKLCHFLQVDIDSTITIDNKIDLIARMNYGSFSLHSGVVNYGVSWKRAPADGEEVIELESTPPPPSKQDKTGSVQSDADMQWAFN